MAIRPDLVDLDKTLETDRSLASHYEHEPQHLARRREARHKYIGVNPAVKDDSNDPELTASVERGRMLLSVISARIAERARALLDECNRS